MEIERITEAAVAASILGLDDPGLEENVLKPNGCTRAEWVQDIIDRLKLFDGNLTRLYAALENEKVKGYMLATNCINPPVTRFFVIEYQAFFGLTDDEGEKLGLKALEEVENWSAENGCRKIVIVCRTEAMARLYRRYGFVKQPEIAMALEF